MKWCGMYVVSGDGRLDGTWMQSDARRCLVRGVRICVAICGMHDVLVVKCGMEMAGALKCMELWVVAE